MEQKFIVYMYLVEVHAYKW